MNRLFDSMQIENQLAKYNWQYGSEHIDILKGWYNFLQQSDKKHETQLQADFLNAIFGEVCGYVYKRGEKEINLEKEQKTEIDGQRPDGILGFFNSNNKYKDVRVVVELKGLDCDLDKRQNRAGDKRSPVDQAFGYVSKYQGVEWVIVSNFKEIRLYKASYAGRYHSFTIKELAESEEKQREFHFLLSKDRLFTKTCGQSPVHALDNAVKGEVIEKEFYEHYSTLRKDIWDALIELNSEKHYGKNFYLYKAQKLIDRIIFIRFCKENGALDNDAVLQALEQKFVRGKYNRIKTLFNSINEGNADMDIPEFNGGLFANDADLDCLEISDEITDKIVALYSYDFGSDLDVNILGHIFEQSISDLESLTGESVKERKKYGVFYTPAYITEYIIKEAVGGWLTDRKTEIKAKENSKEWWQEYAEQIKKIKVLDPACGSGAFLVKVFDYLQSEWRQIRSHIDEGWDHKDILTKNIYGVDINPSSVGITKLSLWLKTANRKQSLTKLDGNIKIGNSLIDDQDIAGYYSEFEGKVVREIVEIDLMNREDLEKSINEGVKKSLAFNWREEFSEVFANGGFDVVVGNPPYGADIDKHAKYFAKKYPNSTKKYKDSYKIFIDKSLQLSTSKVGMIVPNTFLYQPRYEDIKEIIDKYGSVTLNLGEDIFENVEIPTAILLINKKSKGKKIADLRSKPREEIENIVTEKGYTLQESHLQDFSLTNNIKKLSDIVTFKDSGMQYQRNGVGKANRGGGNMSDRMIYEGEIKNDRDIMFFKGRDMDRYYIKNKTERFLRYNFKELLGQNETATFSKEVYNKKKILIRQTASGIISVKDNAQIVFDGTIIAIINNSSIVMDDYIICVLNSKYYKYLYTQKVLEVGKVFPQVKLAYLKDLPFPIIPLKDQDLFIERSQAMVELTKEMREFSDKFLKLLLLGDGPVIKRATKNLKNWYNLKSDEFLKEIAKQNRNLSFSLKSKLLDHFETEKEKALALQNKIKQTDSEIDKMVYELYGLTEEEIKIVEGK